jgi:excisionase family DNA binding protein
METHEPTQYLTVGAAARSIGTSRWTIYAAIRRGELRAARINDRGDLRISDDSLRAYLDARSVVATPAYGGRRG